MVSHTSFGMKMKAKPGDRGEDGVRAGARERALGCGSPYFCRTCPSTGGGLHGGWMMTQTIALPDGQKVESPHILARVDPKPAAG
jgi:hypothetical protein